MKRYIFSLSLCAIASVLLTINWINDPTPYTAGYRATAILAFVSLGGVWVYTKVGSICIPPIALIILAVAITHQVTITTTVPEIIFLLALISSTILIVAGGTWIWMLLYKKK